MKVNVKQYILNLKGEPTEDKTINPKTGETIKVHNPTIGEALMNALMSSYKDDSECSGEDKIKRFKLGLRIEEAKDGVVEFTTDEITFIKKYLNKAGFPPIAYTRCDEALEGKKVESKVKEEK